MEELKKIANTVYDCVQFTTDCPSNYVGKVGEMPVLDLQMCVEDSAIKYEFFEKPCASHYRTVFWQMTDMEYLYGLRGIRYGEY